MNAAEPRRTVSTLPPRTALAPDPSVSRLRRDHRTPPPLAGDAMTDAANAPTTGEGAIPSTSARRADATDTAQDCDPASDLPMYLQLVRKEARLRQDQVDDLTRHVRRLNQLRRHRNGVDGERLTENTLIRVAVDLLLSHPDRLTGTTEDQITAAVLGPARTD